MSVSPAATDGAIAERLREALRYSRFAQRLLAARPELESEVDYADLGPWHRDAMLQFLSALQPATADALASALRKLRARVLLRLAVRDLAGLASLAEVHATMSELADRSIHAATRFWTRNLEADLGVPHARGVKQELLVVGMGKLGGRELNVSSDIDLIFVYPEEGETVGGTRSLSNQDFFDRLGRRIIATLDEATAEGRVFRVDMRLRPWGDGGPLTVSMPALENYLLVHGREWERYAWIKARVCAGGEASDAPEQLAQLVRPFVYRKYLDFGAIGALRALHAQIQQEVARRDLAEHVKLGRGGIREIEFIVQALQLIRGGRDRDLRISPTLDVLRLLAVKGIMAPAVVRELAGCYEFLRRLEHRLQYLDDDQTHVLPGASDDRLLVAQSMGYSTVEVFAEELERVRTCVTRHFDATFSAPEKPASDADAGALSRLAGAWLGTLDDEAARGALAAAGYADPAEACRLLQALRASSRYRGLPAASQTRLDEIMPRLVESAGSTETPDATLARALRLVEAVSGRSSYLALLDERRDALAKLTDLVAASSWAATYLSGHPILLDELLDPQRDASEPDPRAFAAQLREAVRASDGDTEHQMDIMREMHHVQVFRLLALDLAGALTVERLADFLSALADAVLTVTMEIVWQKLVARHRESPRFTVIAFGKLGGKELGYASDLDLAFLYDDPDEAAQANYARLAQRIVTWLTSRTSAGILFDTDLRLRPDGEAGLLVTSIEAFRKYQRESAWVWEHQALTRARACAGDTALGEAFEAEREHILTMERDVPALAAEVLAMRKKMLEAHPNRSELFDAKHDPGGMIDIEFVVQFLVLAHAHRHRRLTGNLGNIALLGIAAELELIPKALAERCQTAYREFRRVQHQLRLNEAQYARVPTDRVAQHVSAARALWDHVFEGYRAKS